MNRFRCKKKSKILDVIRFDIIEWDESPHLYPMVEKDRSRLIQVPHFNYPIFAPVVKIYDGAINVEAGDYLIHEADGNWYVSKPSVFFKIYEAMR